MFLFYIFIIRSELIFRQEREEITRGWRKLNNEELHNFYCSPNIVRVIRSNKLRWARHVARMGAVRQGYKILVRAPEGKNTWKN